MDFGSVTRLKIYLRHLSNHSFYFNSGGHMRGLISMAVYKLAFYKISQSDQKNWSIFFYKIQKHHCLISIFRPKLFYHLYIYWIKIIHTFKSLSCVWHWRRFSRLLTKSLKGVIDEHRAHQGLFTSRYALWVRFGIRTNQIAVQLEWHHHWTSNL